MNCDNLTSKVFQWRNQQKLMMGLFSWKFDHPSPLMGTKFSLFQEGFGCRQINIKLPIVKLLSSFQML